ncbi:MAG: zinc ribbon domain-containing protein [Clostridiales bacterium]|jgi:hypothetical protein|nr:zinc ribbon domain-containing protein [Clostridiales bacterium]
MAEIRKCKTCGATVPAGMKFCATCGTKVEFTANENTGDIPGKKTNLNLRNFNLKKFAMLVVIIIVAFTAINFVYAQLKPSKYGQVKGSISFVPGEGEVTVYTNGNGKESMEGQLAIGSTTEPQWNLDGTTAAFMVGDAEGNWSSEHETYTLYTVTDELQMIDEEVLNFMLSATGDAVVYVKEFDSGEKTAELWLYSGGKKTMISDEYYALFEGIFQGVYLEYVDTNYVVSPKGDAVSYLAYNDGGSHTNFIWDGKAQELGEDIKPFAISDGAKYVYYRKWDGFYAQKGTNKETAQEIGVNGDHYHANADLSQMVFSCEDGTYIVRNGGEKELLSNSRTEAGFVVPYGTALRNEGQLTMYSISNFEDTFYISTTWYGGADGFDVYHINGKYKADVAARANGQIYLADDEKTLIFDNKKGIYKVNGMLNNPEKEECLVEDDVAYFFPTVNGESFFYESDDDEILYQKGKGKSVLVSDEIESYSGNSSQFDGLSYNTSQWYNSAYISSRGDVMKNYRMFQGDTLFYSIDEKLFSSSGKEGEPVDIDGIVDSFTADPFNVFVYSEYDRYDERYYHSSDGKDFDIVDVIFKGVQF